MAYNPVPLVAQGGTGLTSGTSGGILGFTATGVLASSIALTANAIVLGGGVGATPTPLGSLGTNITVLHGNATGAPTFGAVNLATDVAGNLSTSNLNGGSGASSSTFWCGNGTWATPGGTGTVTTTGSPATGNLAKFSGSTSITNGDLAGDVTTSGNLTTTVVAIGGKGIVLGGNLTTTGAFALNMTLTGATSVTMPTSGTLSTTTGTVTSVTFTGDGVILSSTPSSAVTASGTLTAALANAGAGTVLGNPSNASAAPLYTSSPILGKNATSTGTLGLANGGTSGTTVTIQNLGATTAYNFNLPTTAGSSGNVLTSAGGVSANMTWTGTTGTGSVVLSNNATLVTPILGTPQSGTLTNCTGLPLDGIVNIGNATILSNVSGGSAAPSANTMTSLLDIIGGTQGNILYRGASVWTALAPGSNGTVLTSGGAAANPSWTSVGGTGTVTSVTFTGDGTVLSSTPSGAVTTSGTLTAALANAANATVLGNVSGGSAAPVYLTKTQLTTLINAFTSSLSGAVPSSGGGTTNFLRADATWAAPGGGGGGSTGLIYAISRSNYLT